MLFYYVYLKKNPATQGTDGFATQILFAIPQPPTSLTLSMGTWYVSSGHGWIFLLNKATTMARASRGMPHTGHWETQSVSGVLRNLRFLTWRAGQIELKRRFGRRLPFLLLPNYLKIS